MTVDFMFSKAENKETIHWNVYYVMLCTECTCLNGNNNMLYQTMPQRAHSYLIKTDKI